MSLKCPGVNKYEETISSIFTKSAKMLVAEMPHSFMKKNNNYSHCPLKKRPFYYTSEDEDEAPEVTKGDYREIIYSLLCKLKLFLIIYTWRSYCIRLSRINIETVFYVTFHIAPLVFFFLDV